MYKYKSQERGDNQRERLYRVIALYKHANGGISPSFGEIGRGTVYLKENPDAGDPEILEAMNDESLPGISTAVLTYHLNILQDTGKITVQRAASGNLQPRTIGIPGESYKLPKPKVKNESPSFDLQ